MTVTGLLQNARLAVRRGRKTARRLFDRDRWTMWLLQMRGVSRHWDPCEAAAGIARRRYRNYELYKAHQRSKLPILLHSRAGGIGGFDLTEYDRQFMATLESRLKEAEVLRPGMSVLCLGARLGAEVKSFANVGCFAVGVDLNPGPNNPYVLTGDFHDLLFADGSVDVVYTNALDHAFDQRKTLSEVWRVLRPGGWFLAEIQEPVHEGGVTSFDRWEALSWQTIDALVNAIEGERFSRRVTCDFTFPWLGKAVWFEKIVAGGQGLATDRRSSDMGSNVTNEVCSRMPR